MQIKVAFENIYRFVRKCVKSLTKSLLNTPHIKQAMKQ